MAPMKKRTGRPSLGQRDAFTVKLPMHDAVKLREILELQSTTAQAYMEAIICDALARIDVDTLRGQEALPLEAAS